ncbi:MAG: DUF3822 family protein [Mangrovibacterium sp.]
MQKLSLVDETFDPNLTFEYNLSIRLTPDGFSFSMLDTLQNKVVYLFYQELFDSKPEFVLKHLQTIYEESDLINLVYKRTVVLLANSNKLQLIPSFIFADDEIDQYQQLVFSRIASYHTECFNLQNTDYKLVLSTPKIIRSFLGEKHSDAVFMPDLINWEKQLGNRSNLAFVSIAKREVFILLYDIEGKLCSFNSYPWYQESDLLYFILGSIKNQGMATEHVLLSGIVNKFSYIYHQLKSYFKRVEIKDRSKEIYYSYLFDKLPDARFIDLFSSLNI